jgi:4-hydroxybenzoate polyprenyltransferase
MRPSIQAVAQLHAAGSESAPPLVIDLDGSLLHSDLLLESGLAFIRANPERALAPLLWLFSGKAALKQNLAEAAMIDVTRLPYDARVIALIEAERSRGRKIILATASHRIYADRIAAHLGLFDQVMATENGINLSAHNKRDRLIAEYGERGFDYAGNAAADLPVWRAARRAFVVSPEFGVAARAVAIGNVEQVIPRLPGAAKTWFRALRIHQWAKNLLVLVPLLASHSIGRGDWLLHGIVAFVSFGCCASSVYLLNDMLDLEDDRRHERKRQRPLAAGRISLKAALLAIPLLLSASLGLALWLLPWRFAAVLTLYYALTLGYSMVLKRKAVVDVIVLAALYTLRVIAGTYAFSVALTFWMLAFCMFIFLSLALVKRYAELRGAYVAGNVDQTPGRGYFPDDLAMIAALGAASGYLSVLVLALYTQDPVTVSLYAHPRWIWFACPLLLYWISRVWLLAHRGLMPEDPVVFAIRDRASLLVGVLFGAVFWFAT